MKIAVCQINTTVGDFEGNKKKILEGMSWAKRGGTDLAVFPELTLPGYPPRDLLDRPSFIHACLATEEEIARETTSEFACIFGNISRNGEPAGRGLFNSAVFAQGGTIRYKQHKTLLPQYDVFDEERHFDSATSYQTIPFKNEILGLSLCEDIWSSFDFSGRRLYSTDPIVHLKEKGAQLLINISASPFNIGKYNVRRRLLDETTRKYALPIVYCNLVGGNDELVFDGRSLCVNQEGLPVKEGKSFSEDFFIVDLEKLDPIDLKTTYNDCEETYNALILGLKDYTLKCGFKKVLLGLSGGVDSALVATIAVAALGSENVLGILMPSPYSSRGSIEDALELAGRLKIQTRTISIGKLYQNYIEELSLGSDIVSLTHENVQPRIRGTILMALSNQTGALLLSTGNKSELSCGYCTLYGDMAGGFSLIADLNKTLVYSLCNWINRNGELIPKTILEKAPSAELKPGQKDQDTLPPYDVLDQVLKFYIEDHLSIGQIVEKGFDEKVVEKIAFMVDRNEYKRRQAPPGIKLTSKAFGMGRRFPIAWRYQ